MPSSIWLVVTGTWMAFIFPEILAITIIIPLNEVIFFIGIETTLMLYPLMVDNDHFWWIHDYYQTCSTIMHLWIWWIYGWPMGYQWHNRLMKYEWSIDGEFMDDLCYTHGGSWTFMVDYPWSSSNQPFWRIYGWQQWTMGSPMGLTIDLWMIRIRIHQWHNHL